MLLRKRVGRLLFFVTFVLLGVQLLQYRRRRHQGPTHGRAPGQVTRPATPPRLSSSAEDAFARDALRQVALPSLLEDLDTPKFSRLLHRTSEELVARWKRRRMRTAFTVGHALRPGEHICAGKGKGLRLIAYVNSSPLNFQFRSALRRLWSSDAYFMKKTSRVVFVLGSPSPESGNLTVRLREEHRLHRDILQLTASDIYDHMTVKSTAGLSWVSQNCPRALSVMKMDEDIFIDPYHLEVLLNEHAGADRTLLCDVWEKEPVVRNGESKWYVPNWQYTRSTWPSFCRGLFYIMSPDVPELLLRALNNTSPSLYVWLDDVLVTGLAAEEAQVKLVKATTRTPDHVPLEGFSCHEDVPKGASVVTFGHVKGSFPALSKMYDIFENAHSISNKTVCFSK